MEVSLAKEPLNCGGCLNSIIEESYVSALGNDWHTDCFRCSACDVLLSSWYFEKDGLLFCQNDYWLRYGESCQQCGQVITGPVMSAGEHRFHPECFACMSCGVNIEDREPYALVERTKLYCGTCYAEGSESEGRSAHSIRALPVPGGVLRLAAPAHGDALTVKEERRPRPAALSITARGVLRAALALCIQLTCRRIDSACGVLAVRIGDRVLEINGAPARARPLHTVDQVLGRRDAVIQLTIEHDPENSHSRHQTCNLSIDETATEQNDNSKQQNIPKHSIETNATSNANEFENFAPPSLVVHDADDAKRVDEIDAGKRERLFKRKGDGQGKVRMIKRRQAPCPTLLGNKDRSSSMSKLLDVVDGEESSGVIRDLSRARSFRAEPAPGQKVFRACDLQLGELLGSGFFGQVYRVTHCATGEVMVLKQLYRVDEDAQRNFLKEVAVLRSLQHPNVLRFVGVLYKDKRLHLVTEYVAGGTLQQLLQDTSVALCWATRARLARDIAAGVGYLHRMNVIHRDLNSHNCLVREDKTVIVADFGLARIVQRTASSTCERARAARHAAPHRRKRYTVVGNPYWMAPEMMNGNVYDEKVDVFSFGITLCEIIGRVQADPDFLPRRTDFGLNEAQFSEQFCSGCPEPFYRLAFLACQLDPDARPPFEVMEIWLESLVMHLTTPGPLPANLLADILKYAHEQTARNLSTPECCQHNENSIFCASRVEGSNNGVACCACKNCSNNGRSPNRLSANVASVEVPVADGVVKSKSNAAMPVQCPSSEESPNGRALGKCVSASHICQAQRPIVTVTKLSRSQNALSNTPSGFILRAHGKNINITRVDDITEWLDPPIPLKRTSPDTKLNCISKDQAKTRKVEEQDLPSFLRNQSVEGLESESKHDVEPTLLFCRHFSIPDNCDNGDIGTDSSDDDATDMCNWYRNVSSFRKFDKMDVDQSKNVLAGIVKKGESLLGKKSSYDISDVVLRKPRKTEDAVKHIKTTVKVETKNCDVDQSEKRGFFTKNLLSPKLSRLFKPNTTEVVRNKHDEERKDEKSKSKFFIQTPSSPGNLCRPHRIRPLEQTDRKITDKRLNESDFLKSDLKLAGMGKPMTPIFRRHANIERNDFADGRFSYREKRNPKFEQKAIAEPKFMDIGRNRIKAPVSSPLVRSPHTSAVPALATVLEKNKSVPSKMAEKPKIKPAISRSNYVSLANLKINGKSKEIDDSGAARDVEERVSPVESVI